MNCPIAAASVGRGASAEGEGVEDSMGVNPAFLQTQGKAPKVARFDNPGRVSPGCRIPINHLSPNGARFQTLRTSGSRPVGALISIGNVTQGWSPGLSNLAPLGLVCITSIDENAITQKRRLRRLAIRKRP